MSSYRRSPPPQNRGKRDNRHRSRTPDDRSYGAQAKKKVNRQYQPHNYSRDQQRERPRNQQRYESRPSIRIQKKQKIEVKVNDPPSQIKIHFRFKPIKINPKNQQDLIQHLKGHFSSNIGPVEYFQKSYNSYPGYLIMEIGFKYDHDANLYYSGKKGQFQVKLNHEMLNIQAQPTKAFQLLLNDSQSKKKKIRKQSRSKSKESRQNRKGRKRRSKSSSRNKSSSDSNSNSRKSRRSYDQRKQSRIGYQNRRGVPTFTDKPSQKVYQKPYSKGFQRPHQKSHDKSYQQPQYTQRRQRQTRNIPPQQQRQQRHVSQVTNGHHQEQSTNQIKQQGKIFKKLYFFGIHYSVNAKDMISLLYKHQQGPFYSQQFLWRKLNGSISEFLQGKFQQKQALKLLQIGDKMEVKGHPFIIIESQSIQNQKLLQKISQYQVNIQFPKLIQPYYLLKGLKQCGRVIQIISNNKLNQQGRSDYYNVTFNSKDVCQKLRNLKNMQNGIIVQATNEEDNIFIYRPNSKTQLMTVDNFQNNAENDNRNRHSSNSSERSRKNYTY